MKTVVNIVVVMLVINIKPTHVKSFSEYKTFN